MVHHTTVGDEGSLQTSEVCRGRHHRVASLRFEALVDALGFRTENLEAFTRLLVNSFRVISVRFSSLSEPTNQIRGHPVYALDEAIIQQMHKKFFAAHMRRLPYCLCFYPGDPGRIVRIRRPRKSSPVEAMIQMIINKEGEELFLYIRYLQFPEDNPGAYSLLS